MPVVRCLALALAAALAACVGCKSRTGSPDVVVYTSVDQVFSEPVFRDFEKSSGVRVRAVYDTEETKSTGVLNRLIAEGAHPLADVFWSGDSVRPFQLIKRGFVEPYSSPAASGLPASARAPDRTWTGFAARARVLIVNKTKVAAAEMPRSVSDMVSPQWRGKVAIANPLYGTTTMHVAALFAVWGEDKTKSFLNGLKANQARIASSNGEVKRLVVSGEVSWGIADTDDAHEAQRESSDIEVVYPDQDGMGVLVIPTATVVLRGCPHPDQAKKLVDYLVSAEVEQKMASTAAHMPLRPGVVAPPSVRTATSVKSMQVDYGRVAFEMEAQQAWLRQWMGM
ncbi:MAG: extracellular solute-binding protein [Deltaproteobacteria bacterium]|nr:extracellular solute-binding protein [Deltaproteobacteria bacterium]